MLVRPGLGMLRPDMYGVPKLSAVLFHPAKTSSEVNILVAQEQQTAATYSDTNLLYGGISAEEEWCNNFIVQKKPTPNIPFLDCLCRSPVLFVENQTYFMFL